MDDGYVTSILLNHGARRNMVGHATLTFPILNQLNVINEPKQQVYTVAHQCRSIR
jgi:hypothetical protein